MFRFGGASLSRVVGANQPEVRLVVPGNLDRASNHAEPVCQEMSGAMNPIIELFRDKRSYAFKMPGFVFWILVALFVGFLALTQGCALYMVTHPERFTPEQIKAYQEVGQNVFWCFQIAGPPPVGGTTILVLPKTVKPDFAFSGSCQLMKGTIQ